MGCSLIQTRITLCTSLLCGTFQNKLWHRYDDMLDDWLCIQVTAADGNKKKTLEGRIWKKPALGALRSARNINKKNGERHAQVYPFPHFDFSQKTSGQTLFHLRVQAWSRPCHAHQLATIKHHRADFIDVKSKSFHLHFNWCWFHVLIGGRESAAEAQKWTSACWGDVWVSKYTCCNDLTPHFASNGWSRVKAERMSN